MKHTERAKRFHMTIGTPSTPGKQRDFVEVAEMKREARKALEANEKRLQRQNVDGRVALFDAKKQVEAYYSIKPDPEIVDATFDADAGMTIRITMWRDAY